MTAGIRECLGQFSQGLERFQAGDWPGARECFERSAGLEPNIPARDAGVTANPSLVYLDIVAEYSRQPPPAGWDGVFLMKEK